MKKILCLTAIVLTLASFTACSSEDGKIQDNSSTGSNGGMVSDMVSDVESSLGIGDNTDTASDTDTATMTDSDTTSMSGGTTSR